jgi:cell division ATPase FtsA
MNGAVKAAGNSLTGDLSNMLETHVSKAGRAIVEAQSDLSNSTFESIEAFKNDTLLHILLNTDLFL